VARSACSVLLVLNPRGIMGGKVGSACEEFENSEDGTLS